MTGSFLIYDVMTEVLKLMTSWLDFLEIMTSWFFSIYDEILGEIAPKSGDSENFASIEGLSEGEYRPRLQKIRYFLKLWRHFSITLEWSNHKTIRRMMFEKVWRRVYQTATPPYRSQVNSQIKKRFSPFHYCSHSVILSKLFFLLLLTKYKFFYLQIEHGHKRILAFCSAKVSRCVEAKFPGKSSQKI